MASKFADSYYARLGVSKDATAEEIRSAYHEAAKHFHPDTHPEPGVTRLFLEIQEAYEVLSDPQKRAAYDLTLPPLDLAPDVELSTLYSRPYLIRSSSPQLLYILQEIKASPEQRSVASPSLNLCLVIDRSTSMKGARLERVKATARQLLHQLRPDDVLSVIAFSDRAEVILPATRGVNLSRVEARINLIQAGGGTELYHGLLAGLQEVSRYLNPSFVNHLILITDGHTYGDEQACLELAEEAKDRGIAFTGLGIGSEWNDDFIDRLAGKTGGSSIFVSSSKDVRHYLEGQFRGLSQTYAEAVRLKLELPPQVQLRYAFRLSPIPGKLELDASDHPIVLGNIQHKKPLSVLYELFIDHCDREVEAFVVGEGTLIMDIPTRLLPTVRLHVRWEFPIRQTVKNPAPPGKIVEALSRLNLYRMQEQAYKELEEGNYEQATLRLRNLSTHLLAQGEHALAASVLEQVTRIEKGEKDHRGGEVQKRIKYGTRALLLPPGTEQ